MKKTASLLSPREPRIVLWDIETLPDMPAVMEIFPSLSNYPGLTMKASINSIICVGWKVLNEKETHCINAWDYKSRWAKDINDDYAVVKAAYDVLQTADVVVTHNGKRFDWKFLQTRLIRHGFAPLPKIIHVDTCAESKRHLFAFNNSLKVLSKFLTGSAKKENGGWPLWVDVSLKKPKAMKLMTAYCKQDVVVLEKLFKKIRPLMKSLPNANLFKGLEDGCSNCGSQNLQRRGERVTKTQRLQRFQCMDCAAWSSAGKKYPKDDA